MPITPQTASLISAGAQAGSGIFGTISQSLTNRKNRKFALQMYERERSDALADRDFENQYNSPAAQMQRLRDAGLNPNLVYDGGGATSNSVTTKGASFNTPSTEAPRLDMGGMAQGLMSYYDAQYKVQSTNLVEEQIHLAQQEQGLKAAQTYLTLASADKTEQDTESGRFDLSQRQSLADIAFEQAKANLQKTTADTQYTLDQNERAAITNSVSLMEAAERILTMRAQRSKIPAEIAELKARAKNVSKDTELKELDRILKKDGIQPHDPAYIRAIQDFLDLKDNSSDGGVLRPLNAKPGSWIKSKEDSARVRAAAKRQNIKRIYGNN